MAKIYTIENWYGLAKDLYELIDAETNNISDNDLPEIYPKLIVMYEFFRLFRGEAFYSARPRGIGVYQKEIYKIEDEILNKLKFLEKKLNQADNRVAYYLDLMKKSFTLKQAINKGG